MSSVQPEPEDADLGAAVRDFLADHDSFIRWQLGSEKIPVTRHAVFFGQGDHRLEVALASSATGRPKVEAVRQLWQERHGGRASPVLLVVLYLERGRVRATVCGPVGTAPTVETGHDRSSVERLCGAALAEPSRHAAVRFLVGMLDGLRAELIPGLRNAGLLATQELRAGVPQRSDWKLATRDGRRLLGLRGQRLLEGLGFKIERISTAAIGLAAGNERRAVALLLEQSEGFEDPAARFSRTSPVSHGLAVADREELPWVVLVRGHQVRLYAARPDTGVGRKGRAETFVEINLAVLPESEAGYLPLLVGARALVEGGTLEEILASSADFAADLGQRLRERLYDAVPDLATAIARRLGEPSQLDEADLAAAYEQTLTLLFRLLFVAYAEDKDLLPYRTHAGYAAHALKARAKELAKESVDFAPESQDIWDDVSEVWRAVDKGRPDWGVPLYNGGLFSSDLAVNPAGAALAATRLSDAELGPALRALLVDQGPDGVRGPVDFRSLSVREFGTIYEGLLESQLSVAPGPLALDRKGQYVPARTPDSAVVLSGEVYFHNRSGARKATGSYFTKPFAVEHLLDQVLEPALDDHLARIERLRSAGDEAAAAAAFFDFRCADIAMGSGHFLVAAVDRIEARLSAYLALHPIPLVSRELDELRAAAVSALGSLADGVEIEHASLLRRLVARRCVYGVDLNKLAVELARLSIWIHTFVPGLPLSYLDHNLVAGNSLTGIGTLDEVVELLDPGHASLFRESIEAFLGRAEGALRRLGRITDATTTQIAEARAAHAEAVAATEPAHQLFDLAAAVRLSEASLPLPIDVAGLAAHPRLRAAQQLTAELRVLHFPAAFPEVFLCERSGFDCLIGNPPWEKLHVEEHNFWALRFPGLRGHKPEAMVEEINRLRSERPDLAAEYEREQRQAEALRKALLAGPFPGLGRGHPDLYKAFCWRFWHLARDGGRIGVVLPRSALAASGTASWRERVLNWGAFENVVMLKNARGWVFDDVTPQYTIGLITLRKGAHHSGTAHLAGPYGSLLAFTAGRRQGIDIQADELRRWSTGMAFPLLPTEESGRVFLKLRTHARFDETDDARFRPVQGDLNATNDRKYFEFDPVNSDIMWPVYTGASFNLWEPDTGTYYAWADPKRLKAVLQDKRLRQQRHARSAFSELPRDAVTDSATLPCHCPRIAFRDVTSRGSSRTMLAALVPAQVILVHKAPYLLRTRGDQTDEAYLLGILSSIPLDWYARRFVELTMSFDLLNAFPIPRSPREDQVRRRVEEIAGRLAAVDNRYADWAKAVGVRVASVTEAEKPDLIAELDAAVAVLYGLDEADVRHIFETFHEGWDYRDRLQRVLGHFRRLQRRAEHGLGAAS